MSKIFLHSPRQEPIFILLWVILPLLNVFFFLSQVFINITDVLKERNVGFNPPLLFHLLYYNFQRSWEILMKCLNPKKWRFYKYVIEMVYISVSLPKTKWKPTWPFESIYLLFQMNFSEFWYVLELCEVDSSPTISKFIEPFILT